MVVLGHLYQHNVVKTWIYSFHMPIFFFLSGYLFERDEFTYSQFIKRRFLSLVVPYFSFATISYLYWVGFERYFRPNGMSVDVYEPIIAYIYGNRGGMEPNMVLWFLPCLFMAAIIFLFVSKTLRRQNLILLVLILFSVIGYWGLHVSLKMPWSIDAAFNGVVFYGLGYLIKENLLSIKTRAEAILNRKVLFSILLIFVNVPFSIKNGFTSIENNMNNFLYYYVAGLSGIGAVILFSKSIKWPGFVSFFGKNALIILSLHEPAKRIVLKGISILTNIPTDSLRDSLIGGIFCCILTVFLLVPFIWIINNYFGFMLGRFGKGEA